MDLEEGALFKNIQTDISRTTGPNIALFAIMCEAFGMLIRDTDVKFNIYEIFAKIYDKLNIVCGIILAREELILA